MVESARFAVSAGDKLFRRSSDMWSSLEKSSALFSSRVAIVLDLSSGSSNSPSVGAMNTNRASVTSDSNGG